MYRLIWKNIQPWSKLFSETDEMEITNCEITVGAPEFG